MFRHYKNDEEYKRDKAIEELSNDIKKIKLDLSGCFLPQYVGAYEDAIASALVDLGYVKVREAENANQ